MQSLQRIATLTKKARTIYGLKSPIPKLHLISKSLSTKPAGEDEWNDAWETAWLPDHLSPKDRPTWESDVHFPSPAAPLPADADAETRAFVEEMEENWDERRKMKKTNERDDQKKGSESGDSVYSLEKMKKDYRLKKQRIHAGLWVKEIEKLKEANFGDSGADDIDRLLDTCSEIFDSANNDLNNSKIPSSSELQNKPDGWETTSKAPDGSVWEMSQREEDILLQEYDRRIAYCKFQIASFVKTHIFSRRRPIDGWKYMIEVVGPNARKGKGSVSRMPSLDDGSTQAFKEEVAPTRGRLTPLNRR